MPWVGTPGFLSAGASVSAVAFGSPAAVLLDSPLLSVQEPFPSKCAHRVRTGGSAFAAKTTKPAHLHGLREWAVLGSNQ